MAGRAVIVAGERVALTAPAREEFVGRWEVLGDPVDAMLLGSPAIAQARFVRTMPPATREQREALYEQHVARTVLCFDACAGGPDGRCVAEAHLCEITWPRASGELEVVVFARDDRRQGYGAETAALVCAYAFDGLGLNRISWRFPVSNSAAAAASERLARDHGARRVGVAREAEWVSGAHGDVAVWELLRRDFPPHPGTAELRTPPGEFQG
ncbi:MAG TPA: GNAT family protein [Thermoleophilaceae bacterium]|nr:GNAT family protein [Thermoleophilaceae bacterium]